MALFEKEETILKSARQSHFLAVTACVCSLKKPGNLVKNIYYLQMKVS